VLDAPSLEDDFYLSLLDWSQQNILGVGLANSIYLWNANNGTVLKLLDLDNDKVTSLKFLDKGDKIAVGSVSGESRIVDIQTQKNTHV
jgi:cell division cycle 20-like protein 1 (cofactor of APC complex)